MILTFKTFAAKQKKRFYPNRYEQDMHYRAVLFHQYGEQYRWYCKNHQIAHEYDQLAYEVAQYEKRIQMYRNA